MADSASDRTPADNQSVEAIHASSARGVFAVTGGGSGAVSALLETPGASRTVLEASVPYCEAALREWVGGAIDGACCEETARAMAMASLARARRWAGAKALDSADERAAQLAHDPLFGLAATAALATDRPKRGPHRVHAAVQTIDRSMTWSLELAKGQRTRREEEAQATRLILHAAAVACGVANRTDFAVANRADKFSSREVEASPLWGTMVWGEGLAARIDPAGDRQNGSQPTDDRAAAILPGSFNPLHSGHERMVEVAERLLGRPVALELSLTNVDKPPLDFLAIDDRLRGIGAALPGVKVWLTRMPTFTRKSHQFPAGTFVVGADTISRIGDPRYYRDQVERDAAIAQLADRGCRFLVFGRVAGDRFETLDELDLPPALRSLCDGVPESEFRVDISSTAVRRESAG